MRIAWLGSLKVPATAGAAKVPGIGADTEEGQGFPARYELRELKRPRPLNELS